MFLPRPRPRASLRLLCFPPAGYGAAIYRELGRALPEQLEVCSVRLPGRENLRAEPLIKAFPRLIEAAIDIVAPYLDRPFAIFGHSMGSWLAFEVSRRLRNTGRLPAHLFVSGRRAPQITKTIPPIHDLPDDEFIAEIQRRYNGIPQTLLDEPELLQLTLPILRADLAALDSYEYSEDAVLDCAISCYAGLHDHELKEDELAAWREQTRKDFKLIRFPGDHFYLTGAGASFLHAEIGKTLTANT